MGEERRQVREEVRESIAGRLSLMDNLYFPRALQPSAADPTHWKSLLLDLLSHDVAVFLERYGSLLTGDELREFDTLNGDYEINWHLKHLRSKNTPTSEDLDQEDAMREREPYLHHEYVGKFQDPIGRSMARPGERWSETLMRRCEEARLVAEIRDEQQRLGVAPRNWVGNEVSPQEEEESEEEDEEEVAEEIGKMEVQNGNQEQAAQKPNAINTRVNASSGSIPIHYFVGHWMIR